MTNYSRSVLLSNGFPYSKIRLKKFDFSPIDTPANIAKKLPSQRCSQPFLIAFSTSHTNGPRSLSLPKAGTHSPFGERWHIAAYTPKQGPSLPRPQHGLVPSAKFLLVLHAFIYIHFPVHCEPSTPAEEKNLSKLLSQTLSQTIFHRVFQLLPQTAHVCLHSESGYTPGFRRKIAHKRLHGETGVVSGGGGITTLGAFRTFTNIPGPGIRTAYFAAFGPWSRGISKNAESLRNSDALMRVAVPRRRGPAGPRDLFASAEVAACTPCAQCFPNVRDEGWYHYPQCALRAAETPDGRLSKRLTCRFLRSGGHH